MSLGDLLIYISIFCDDQFWSTKYAPIDDIEIQLSNVLEIRRKIMNESWKVVESCYNRWQSTQNDLSAEDNIFFTIDDYSILNQSPNGKIIFKIATLMTIFMR